VGTSFLDDHASELSMGKKPSALSVVEYAQDRKPLITPTIQSSMSGSKGESDGQQYLLIPNKDHILVLSMSHGQTVCKLVSHTDDKDEQQERSSCNGNRALVTATILKYKKSNTDVSIDNAVEFSVIAGFSDGTLEEWFLSSIPLDKSKSKTISPTRKLLLPKEYNPATITHITSPVEGDGGILYALVTIGSEIKFIRVDIPCISDEEEDDGVSLLRLINTQDLKTFAKPHNTEAEMNDENVRETTSEKKHLVLPKVFSLASVCCERKGVKMTYVVAAHKRGLVVYCDNYDSRQTIAEADRFILYPQVKGKKSICAFALAPNGEDVALGYVDGKIDILVSVLSRSASYVEETSPSKVHPQDSLIVRTIHWHALPVKTLCYLGLQGSRAAPSLISGGEEAVVVMWNVERGLNRPSNTLPRISKGCITHIVTNPYSISGSASSTDMDIIVRCMDNTLQLIHGNNHAIRWKIQGLASSNNECVDITSESNQVPSPMLHIDPKTRTLLMTRLAGAPGFIHWYDLTSNQVVGELEVAPYNRISRKEAHHNAYPRPTVTNFVFSDSGNDLITVDTMLTENLSLGKSCEVESVVNNDTDLSKKMSLVTNIKFWSRAREVGKRLTAERHGKGMPFELISAMPNPHGYINGEIDALAISRLGNRACSLSSQEGAFHIWGKGKTFTADKNSLSPLQPSWKRLCKITIPSGYSSSLKHGTGQDKNSTVAFSNDGSVLAIAFGRHITLWDHSNATLLKTLCTHESLCDIQFVRSPLDMILAVGKSSVSILPPFSSGYLGNNSWSYKLPEKSIIGGTKIELGLVTPLVSRKELAVTMRQTQDNAKELMISTKIVIVDIMSGKAKERNDGTVCSWEIEGNVLCLCDISQIQEQWASEQAVLLALNDRNDIFVLDTDDDRIVEQKVTERSDLSLIQNTNSSALSSTGAPKLEMYRKRKSEEVMHGVLGTNSEGKNIDAVGKGSLVFDSAEATPLSTSQLPALSGNFARSFMSRNFKKLKHND